MKIVPPFDIQEVPKAKRKLSMPTSAELQERCFAGEANYSQSADDLRAEINQKGMPYAPSMIDSTSMKMSGMLSFKRAKRAFDELIQEFLRTPSALDTLKTQLTPYQNSRSIFAWQVVNGNLLEFHKKFQFQRISVNASWGEQLSRFLERAIVAGASRTT